MSEAERVSTEEIGALLARAGLDLSPQEIESIRPVYDHYASQAAKMQELDLDDGDLAVIFSPQAVIDFDGVGT